MIRGDTLDIDVKDLNTIREFNLKDPKNQEEFDKYYEYVGSPLYGSEYLRKAILELGEYKILSIYPCYYQGWEMDEWGAIAEKDGKKYAMETSHGGLQAPVEIEDFSLIRSVMKILNIGGK